MIEDPASLPPLLCSSNFSGGTSQNGFPLLSSYCRQARDFGEAKLRLKEVERLV